VVVVLVIAAILWSPFEPHREPVGVAPAGAGESAPAGGGPGLSSAQTSGERWLDDDWAIFESTVRQAAARGLDTAPLGTAIAEIGRTFVGTAYVPQTLEVEGPEGLVINFRGLDCVTFVESAFTLARFVKAGGAALLGDRPAAEARYEALLTELRYRDGVIDGYPSRLHYFSDWIADNARRGLVVDLGVDLGGVRDDEPVDFMTTHPDAYRQLADAANVARVREAEARLSAAGRTYVPQERIAEVADRIRDGDVIAATSTVPGLDIAHTGLALRIDGRLHLLHAPLVGDSVEISEVPLAERIRGISGQDGIMVARPVER
jgi:hypothetical protein